MIRFEIPERWLTHGIPQSVIEADAVRMREAGRKAWETTAERMMEIMRERIVYTEDPEDSRESD